MAAPSEKELVAIGKFREAILEEKIQLTEKQNTDMALVAWLRAQGGSIRKATEMLNKSCIWRKEYDIDNILKWTAPPYFSNILSYEFSGKAADGCPVLVLPFGKWDMRKAIETDEKDKFHRYLFSMLENALDRMDKTNTKKEPGEIPVTQCVFICDFEGFSISQITSYATVQALLECVTLAEANYPDFVKNLYYINAPWAFKIFFSLVKRVMSAGTISRIKVFTSDETQWKPTLLKNIPEDQLPVYLGGTNDTCKFFSEEFASSADSYEGTEEFVTEVINGGDEFTLEYDITKANTALKWAFKTESHAIGFAVVYGETEVFANKKCKAQKTKQTGTINCQKPGTYTFVFHNKKADRSNTLHYMITLDD